MSDRVKAAAIVVAIIALNLFFVPRAVRYAGLYPFLRIAVDGSLFHRISLRDEGAGFRSQVLSVGTADFASADLPAILAAHNASEPVVVRLFDRAGDVYELTAAPRRINENLAWLFMILTLVANVHVLWGFAVWMKNPEARQARLYCIASLFLGLVYFCAIDLFSYAVTRPAFMFAAVMLGGCIIMIASALTGGRPGVVASGSYGALCIALSALYYLDPLFLPGGVRASLLFVPPCLAVAFFMIILARFSVMQRNVYALRSGGVVGVSFFAGVLIPFGAVAAGYWIDIPLPLHITLASSVLIPVLIGNGLMRPVLFSTGARFGGGFALFVINGAIALLAALALLYVHNTIGTWREAAAVYPAFALMIALLLYIRRIVNRRLNDILFVTRDDYAGSLQVVAEHVASPGEISVKLRNIADAVQAAAGVTSLGVALFDSRPDPSLSRPDSPVEFYAPDTALARYLVDRRGMVFRYSLAPGRTRDGEILSFMRSRGLAMIVPVFTDDRLRCAVFIGEKRNRTLFIFEDVRYLGTIAFQIHQMIENDRLFREYLLRTAYEKELDIASYVQLRLFPKRTPPRRGLAITFYNRPFFKVTGDYFDFVTIDRNRTAIIIGDISGHGLSAAMVLSMTGSIIATLLRERKSIQDIMGEINFYLTRRYRGTDLITLFIGVYNKQTRELVYTNAGHCPPVLVRPRAGIAALGGRSKILGADPSASFASASVALAKGDELILYTDGVIELYDEKKNESFDEKDVLAIIERHRLSDTEQKVTAILERINRFPNESIKDDITLIGVTIT